MVANSQLRANAKQQLGNKIFCSTWMKMLLICAFIPLADAALCVTGAGIILVTGVMQYGLARVTTNCAKGAPWGIGQFFDGFKESFGRSLALHIVHSIFLFLWTMLFIIPGIVKSYSYALVYYLQQEPDSANKGPVDLITQSRQWMKGHKWQLFCLDLSFIGWYILGALCFGVGTFFVTPYHQTARANFYLALRAEKEVYTPSEETI